MQMTMIDLIVVGAAITVAVFVLLNLHAYGIDKLAKRVETLERNAIKLSGQAARIETLERELAINARGYFLRDDLPLRQGSEHFAGVEQAYSLFQKSPYERVHVYGGPKPWAVDQAYEQVFGKEAA